MSTTNKDKIRAAAQKYLQKGQLDKAIREFERLVEEDPSDVRTLLKIGDLQTRAGDQTAATQTYMGVAKHYSDGGFFLKAVAVYKQILKLDPSLMDVNTRLAELYRQLGLLSDAVMQYRAIAEALERQNRLPEALETLSTVLELDPENLASRVQHAELCIKVDKLDEARAGFKRAADKLKADNRTDDYVKVAERLIHVDPADLVTTRELAEIYVQKGDARRALAKLQICFRANPKDIHTLELLASAFNELGQGPKAVSVYHELAELYADDAAAKKAVMQKVLAIDPEDAVARQALAGPTSRTPGATPHVPPVPSAGSKATRGAPAPPAMKSAPTAMSQDDVDKLLVEADIYIKYGLQKKAIDHLRNILHAYPDHRDAQERFKGILTDAGNPEDSVPFLLGMAESALRKSTPDLARRDLNELLRMDPGHTQAKALLAKLPAASTPEAAIDVTDDAIVIEDDEVDSNDVIADDAIIVEDDDADLDALKVTRSSAAGPSDVEDSLADDAVIVNMPEDVEDDGIFLSVDEDEADSDAVVADVSASPAAADDDGLDAGLLVEVEDEAAPEVEVAMEGLEDLDEERDVGKTDRVAAAVEAPADQAGAELASPSQADDGGIELGELALADGRRDAAAQSGADDEDIGLAEQASFDTGAIELGEQTVTRDDGGIELADEAIQDDKIELAYPAAQDGEIELADPTTKDGEIELADPTTKDGEIELADPTTKDGEIELADPTTKDGEIELADPTTKDGEIELADPTTKDGEIELADPTTKDGEIELAERAIADDGGNELAGQATADDGGSELSTPYAAAPAAGRHDVGSVDDELEALRVGKEPVKSAPQQATHMSRAASAHDESDDFDIASDLEEIAFYLDQGLNQEASEILLTLGFSHPDDPRVQALQARLNQPPPELSAKRIDAAISAAAQGSPQDADAPLVGDDFQMSFEDVFSQFKRGVEQQVSREDFATHYNLGIAYKEMGLIDDALREFALTSGDKEHAISALTMLGLCEAERGNVETAISHYKRGLAMPQVSEEEEVALRYELGNLYALAGDAALAQEYFSAAHAIDPEFRDLSERLAQFAPPGSLSTQQEPRSKAKVSFL